MVSQLPTDEMLMVFAQRTRELSERRLVRKGMNTKLTISWDCVSSLLRQKIDQPDEEDLRSYLLEFRQFISKQEPVFLSRIFNECFQNLDSSELQDELKKAQEEWKLVFQKIGAFQLVIDDKKLTGEYILDLWINGYYFHNDVDKANELHRYLSNNSMALVRMQFLSVLSALTNIILYVGNVVNYGLREGLFRRKN
jgi:hypothetical protein